MNLLQLLWATLSNLYATGWCTFILSEIFLFIKLSICSYKQGLKDAPTPQILFVDDRFCPMVNSFLKFGACCNAVGSAPPETNNCCRSFSSFSSATQTFLVNRRQDPLTPVEDFAFRKRVYNTRTSQVVTHPSTTQARRCLTLEIRRDPVISPWYGRRQE